MKAIVLAGGRGTRLKPHTEEIPKPLLPIHGKPILEILLLQLSSFGFNEISLCLGHHSESFDVFLTERRDALPDNLQITSFKESKPLGTAGAVRQVDFRGENCLVINGDVLTNQNLRELMTWHERQSSLLTIATKNIENRLELGILELDKEHTVSGYKEKPVATHTVSMGVYVYSPETVKYIEENERIDFPDLVLRLLQNNQKVTAFPSSAFWLHIGTPEQYRKAESLLAENKDLFNVGNR